MDWKKALFKGDEATANVVVNPPTAARPNPSPGMVRTPIRPTFSIGRASTPIAVATPSPNQEFVVEIEKVLAGNTIFTTLQTQLTLLEAAIPDEGLRLQTAIASVVALSKVPEDQVIRAVRAQLDKLLQHDGSFKRNLTAEVQTRTQQYTNHITDLQKQMADNEAKRAALALEMQRLETDLSDTESHLSGIEAERDKVQGEFDSTFATYYHRLQSMVEMLGVAGR